MPQVQKRVNFQTRLENIFGQDLSELLFILAMWFLSRLVIIVAMQLVAPALYASVDGVSTEPPADIQANLTTVPKNYVPTSSWELFLHWDGIYYRSIALLGYEYTPNDGKEHSIAFFPLYPLLIRALMAFGVPFVIAGILINNLAFLAALYVLYIWTKEFHDRNTARWATAVMAWCPLSLFCTVVYTEGLFLFFSTAALRAFDRHNYGWTAIWGALATATRSTGMTLIPAFLLVAWRERRPVAAYAAALATGIGLLLFSGYLAIHFGDPLAFVHIQHEWRRVSTGWPALVKDFVTFGKDWILNLYRFGLIFGGGYLLWHFRRELNRSAVLYGFLSMAMIIASRITMSTHRHLYGIVSISLVIGMFLARHARWGYALMLVFGGSLVIFSIRFAAWEWVAYSLPTQRLLVEVS